MSNKHIPGPWWVTDSLGNGGGHTVRAVDPADDFRLQVCEVWGVDNDRELDERSRANAQLIAAAPDLLEALELLYDHSRLYTQIAENVDNVVSQAIAKAKAKGEGKP